MKEIVDSIQFSDSTEYCFEPDENAFTAVNLFSKIPQWYKSQWFGNYYDSTKGWIYHEYFGWIYSEGAV